MKKTILLLTISLGLATAQATLIINTGTPSGGNPASLISKFGGTSSQFRSEAGQFTLTQSTTITDVRGYMANYGGFGGIMDAVIYNGTMYGSTPAPDIYSQIWSGSFSSNSTTESWQGLSGLNLNFSAGTYWLAFEPEGTTFYGWMPTVAPSPLAHYAMAGMTGGGIIAPYGAAQRVGVGIQIEGVTASSAPEPGQVAASLLLLVGLSGYAVAKRRRLMSAATVA